MQYGDALQVLELDSGFTEEDLKRQYRLLAKRYHSDNPVSGDKDKFETVHKAYKFLLSHKQEQPGPEMTHNAEKCPRCSGTGQRREAMKTARGMVSRKVPCQYCKGTGYQMMR